MSRHRLAAIFYLSITWLTFCASCEVDDVAVYKVTVHMLWSEDKFPKDYPVYPLYRPKAQWSPVFGQSHNGSYALYRLGEVAKPALRNFAQFGSIDQLVAEGDEESKVYDQFSTPAVHDGVGETENTVFVDGKHSLVSLISRIIPSPDWFIGVDSLNLCVDSSWLEEITLDLEPLDGGAASGLTFTAPRYETAPPDPVTRHGPRQPDHPAAGFYYPNLRELPPIATVQFTKIKEYTTIDLNNLARKLIRTTTGKKSKRNGMPAMQVNRAPLYSNEEITPNTYIGSLKDLEEDPVGTPRPNLPENNVIIVTTAATTTTGEPEFGSDLRNIDDVVLAVAQGHKMGLGKHLPRHFRSRLHHAVNKVQPNDCLVSDWGEWTACSVTCGFGDKFRYRTVVREKQDGGKKCPKLTERKHCGNVNSCAQIDYFEW